MSEPWRTSTVVALCRQMRADRDYGLAPILADALEDADYHDREVLDRLRAAGTDRVTLERLVALLYSDETAAAVRWVEQFAAGLDPDGYDREGTQPDYPWLMDAARRWVEHEGYTTQHGGEDWRDRGVPREFWDAYALITGGEPEWGKSRWRGDHGRGSFFSCSC